MQEIQQQLIQTAMVEGFIQDDTIAIDATHIEARDQAPPKNDQLKPEPKKRGRKPKAEHEAWLKQKQLEEEQKKIYEKDIAAQLDESYELLSDEMQLDSQRGVKKNSKGKNVFWYGYKGHLVVGTKSQYILGSMLSSGNLNDGKEAIPLLKGLTYHFPDYTYKHATLDAGYDSELIYSQIREAKAQSNIAYNRRREPELEGFDEHFALACGSEAWKQIAKQRSAVERVNAYLKEFFQLNNVRYRTGKRAKVHFDLVTLVFNSTKLASDRLKQRLHQNLKKINLKFGKSN